MIKIEDAQKKQATVIARLIMEKKTNRIEQNREKKADTKANSIKKAKF